MQLSDLDGIARSGARAQARGASYFDNPWLISDLPFGENWRSAVTSWWTGWMNEDSGRDEVFGQLQAVRFW